jgi:chaperone BCS1
VILIEDVDAFFQSRVKADAQVRVSYSGFINALDGVAAHEGSVVFLTTNHPQLIDEAAIRSGRVDFRLELGLCDRGQLERMYLKFIDDPSGAARFADTVAPDRWSPAQVQERLLKAGSPEEALALFEVSPAGDVALLRAA